MALEIKIENPEQPDDTMFDVGGVLVKNGGSVTLDKEQEERFVSRHGMSVRDALANSAHVTVSGSAILSGKDVEELNPERSFSPPVEIAGEEVEVPEPVTEPEDLEKEGDN